MSTGTAGFERTPPVQPVSDFFTDRPQKDNPGRHSHMRGFVRPHNILTAEALSLAAAVSVSPTD